MARKLITTFVGAAAWAAVSVTIAQEEVVPLAPPFNPPALTPSLLDFVTGAPIAEACKLSKTDPLLRPPFAGAPIDTPKGLAADIKAKELDVPNRIAAAQYLGTLDCVAFPEARKMLIAMAMEDPFEPVRYEAVMAIRIMLARGMDNPRRAALYAGCGCQKCEEREEAIKKAVKETEKHQCHAELKALCPKNPCELVHQVLPKILHAPCKLSEKIHLRCQTGVPEEALRYDWCKGCCDAETLNALSKIANELDEQGCPLEPSPRVRAAAADALMLCDCIPKPVEMVPVPAPAPPVAPIPEGEGDIRPRGEGDLEDPLEGVPPRIEEPPVDPLELDPMAGAPRILKTSLREAASADAPPLTALEDYCIVNLNARRFVQASPEFASIYKGRTFFFASAQAKSLFDASPDRYAPAFCGVDPVVYVTQGEVREGALLREHGGRFYLFVDEASWQTFAKDPARFADR